MPEGHTHIFFQMDPCGGVHETVECEHQAAQIMQLIGVREGAVLLPGFDDEEVDGSLDIRCCDYFDTQGLVTFILTLLFVGSFYIHSGVNRTCFLSE